MITIQVTLPHITTHGVHEAHSNYNNNDNNS